MWKTRYLYAQTSGLYYQHVDSKGKPKGKVFEIVFASFALVKASSAFTPQHATHSLGVAS